MRIGRVAELARYPVKSMAGERLASAEVGERGLVADRAWAAYTGDGGIGSGKTTRRFRRVDGLLDVRARCADDLVPLLLFPDGQERRADDPEASTALSALLGEELQLRPEAGVAHHDESPLHVITTAGLRRLERLLGRPVDPARFRANVIVDVEGDDFVEDAWQGRRLALGGEVVLALGAGMPRCVMVGLPQPHEGLGAETGLLTALGQIHEVEFGLQAEVVRAGTLRCGNVAVLV